MVKCCCPVISSSPADRPAGRSVPLTSPPVHRDGRVSFAGCIASPAWCDRGWSIASPAPDADATDRGHVNIPVKQMTVPICTIVTPSSLRRSSLSVSLGAGSLFLIVQVIGRTLPVRHRPLGSSISAPPTGLLPSRGWGSPSTMPGPRQVVLPADIWSVVRCERAIAHLQGKMLFIYTFVARHCVCTRGFDWLTHY